MLSLRKIFLNVLFILVYFEPNVSTTHYTEAKGDCTFDPDSCYSWETCCNDGRCVDSDTGCPCIFGDDCGFNEFCCDGLCVNYFYDCDEPTCAEDTTVCDELQTCCDGVCVDSDKGCYPLCYRDGLTWEHSGALSVISGVESALACQTSCIGTSSCSSFTWYDPTSSLTPHLCILYEYTEEEVPCASCVSGPSSCTCSSEFACVISGDNLIEVVVHVPTEMECLIECASVPDCHVYSWYDQTAVVFANDCFLFSSCDEVDQDKAGSHSGPVDCDISTTATEETSTSSEINTTSQIKTTPVTLCNIPENPKNGEFNCFSSDPILFCDLLCDPGFAAKYRSRTQCHDEFWSLAPEKMLCEESILLVTGGELEQNRAELYSTDGNHSCSLDILPSNFYNHSLHYVDGDIIMMESFHGQTLYYGETYIYESDGRWISTSSEFKNDHYNPWYAKAMVMVQRSKLFAAAKYGKYDIYTTIALEMSPANNFDWSERFTIFDEIYDSHDFDTPYDEPCSVSVSWDTFVITGLYDNSTNTYKNTVLVNTATGKVTSLEPMVGNRRNHGCTHYKKDGVDYVLVAGGQDDGDLASSEILNLSTRKWQSAGNLSVPRAGLQLAVVEGGKVLATGVDHMKGVEEFDTDQRQWNILETKLRLTRKNHAVTPIPTSLISCETL